MRNEAFSQLMSSASLQNIARGVIELLFKDFSFYEFLKIFYTGQYIPAW